MAISIGYANLLRNVHIEPSMGFGYTQHASIRIYSAPRMDCRILSANRIGK